MKILLLFSYYYENSIIIYILLEFHAFEREGFTIRGHIKGGLLFFEKGIHKKGVLVNPLNPPPPPATG